MPLSLDYNFVLATIELWTPKFTRVLLPRHVGDVPLYREELRNDKRQGGFRSLMDRERGAAAA